MASNEEFEKAQTDIKKLTERPSNEELLNLYAYFKQASEGDVSGSRPGVFKVKDRAKYDAWDAKKGMGEEDARSSYVNLVNELLGKYPHN